MTPWGWARWTRGSVTGPRPLSILSASRHQGLFHRRLGGFPLPLCVSATCAPAGAGVSSGRTLAGRPPGWDHRVVLPAGPSSFAVSSHGCPRVPCDAVFWGHSFVCGTLLRSRPHCLLQPRLHAGERWGEGGLRGKTGCCIWVMASTRVRPANNHDSWPGFTGPGFFIL